MISYSRAKRSDLYIPFTAAHTYIAHIRQYRPPGLSEVTNFPAWTGKLNLKHVVWIGSSSRKRGRT